MHIIWDTSVWKDLIKENEFRSTINIYNFHLHFFLSYEIKKSLAFFLLTDITLQKCGKDNIALCTYFSTHLRNLHCVKSVCIRSYSGPHFPAIGMNTERYFVSLRIQSECGKMRTRITPNTDTFCAVHLTF